MKLLAAFCLVVLLAVVTCSPALERRRRQTAVDVNVDSQGGRPVGTVGVSRQTSRGNFRVGGTFGAGKPLWSGSYSRQRGPTSLGLNVDHQGGRTRGGLELTHRSNRWGDFSARGNLGGGGQRSFGLSWRKRFRRDATEEYESLMALLDE